MVSHCYHQFPTIKHFLQSQYPTEIRRTVMMPHVIALDHSVNVWLYARWVKHHSVNDELNDLHQTMKQMLLQHLGNPAIDIEFVHLDPTTTKGNGGYYEKPRRRRA